MKKNLPLYLRIIISLVTFIIIFVLGVILMNQLTQDMIVSSLEQVACDTCPEDAFECFCTTPISSEDSIKNNIILIVDIALPLIISALAIFIFNRRIKSKH